MSGVDDNLDLLIEFDQWKATQKVAQRDLSPEEFMRDRLKQVAFDRVDAALKYMDKCGILRMSPNTSKLRQILEGTYVEPEPDNREVVRAESIEPGVVVEPTAETEAQVSE